MIIQSNAVVGLDSVEIKRNSDGHIWIYRLNGHFFASQTEWRSIIKQVEALLDEPKPEQQAAPERHPGWVFIDNEGDAWGFDADDQSHPRAPGVTATHPFRTRAEAEAQGKECSYDCREVREWRPKDRVPPMPEGAA